MRDNMGVYRGKRVDNGEWVEGFYSQFYRSDMVISHQIFVPDGRNPFIAFGGMWNEVDPATVGEFTGLCDRNGKRIFEGDVVLDSYDEMAGTVTYRCDDGLFAFISNEDEMYDFADIDSKDFEIIGTIHDRKEMAQ